jgi:hypothetical protein
VVLGLRCWEAVCARITAAAVEHEDTGGVASRKSQVANARAKTAQHSQHEQANRQTRQPTSTASATYHRET